MTSLVAGLLRGALVGGIALMMGVFVIIFTTAAHFPDPVPAVMALVVFVSIAVIGYADPNEAEEYE